MIAEPWDIGLGGYQLGDFPPRGANGTTATAIRCAASSAATAALVGELATRLAGSADIFAGRQRPLSRSINFVTAHDGFTLADLVAYERKHNRRMASTTATAPTTTTPGTTASRARPTIRPSAPTAADMRALLAALIFSRGTPMLAMGDELGRSQHGNNNAYAQDSPIAWLDWSTADSDLLEFSARAIGAARAPSGVARSAPLTGTTGREGAPPDVAWFGASGLALDDAGWDAPGARLLVAALYERGSR